jgi:ATP-dependent exoDNAse (exonuclease V) alpha subunit
LEEVVATCDRLLGDLDRGRERLDARTVLVVSEAAMVGSRKLTRLLEHAEQAQAKLVWVGDDRQLAAIDAGGGFHALRLRLGASELTEVATVEATARQPLVSLPPGRAPRSGGRALCGSRPPAS